MNIQQIDYILAVSELQSFGKAANKCFVTQSTLSTMVARFESEVGITIFNRKTKPISPTKEGVALISQLKIIAKEIQTLDEVVQVLKGEISGSLKIGILPTIAPFLLPHFLNDFAIKFPKLQFIVSEISTATIKAQLLQRDLDIGILAIPLQIPNLAEIPLYNEPFVLYDCQSSPQKKDITLDELNLNRFWLMEEGHCLRTQVVKICDYDSCKNQENINFEFKAGSIDSLIRFVKMNKGMTLLPSLAIHDFPAKEKKKISFIKAPTPARMVGLVTHKHFVKKNILKLLKREIQDKVAPLLHPFSASNTIVSPV